MVKKLILIALLFCSLASTAQERPPKTELRPVIFKELAIFLDDLVYGTDTIPLSELQSLVSEFLLGNLGGSGKLSISDTGGMLNSYTRYTEFLDSIADVRAAAGDGGLSITQIKADGDVRNPQTLGGYDTIGRNWLIANADALWEFKPTATEFAQSFALAPDSIVDLTGNGWTLGTNSGTFTPKWGATINERGAIESYAITDAVSGDYSGYRTNTVATSLINGDCEVHFKVGFQDGTASYYFMGLNLSTNRRFCMRTTAAGKLEILLDMNSGSISYYLTDAALFSDGVNDPCYIRVRFDFTTDALKVYKNGIEYATSLTSGPGIASQSPGFGWAQGYGVGMTMAGATSATNSDAVAAKLFKSAVTPLLSDAEARDVAAYFTDQSDLVIGEPFYSPAVKGGKTASWSIQLNGSTPTDNVVVTVTGSRTTNNGPFTFTTSNWQTPQAVTITATDDGKDEGYRIDTLTITAKGGGYNLSREVYQMVTDDSTDYRILQAHPIIHSRIIQLGIHPDTLRKIANDSIFGCSPSGAFPVYANLDSSVTGYTGDIHKISRSLLDATVTTDKLIFSSQDRQGYEWIQRSFWLKRTDKTNDKIAFLVCGHGSEGGHSNMANKLLLNGYDVMEVSLPITNRNTETNPNVSSTGVAAHNDILTGGLDANDTSHLYLFLESIFETLNYIDSVDAYSQYAITGISGGGWTAMMAGALDNRFTATGIERGVSLPQTAYASSETDYEQGGIINSNTLLMQNAFSGSIVTEFYKSVFPYLDALILTGEAERVTYQRANVFDNCCHEGSEWDLILPITSRYHDNYILDFERNIEYTAHSYDSLGIAATVEAFLKGRVRSPRAALSRYYTIADLNDTLAFYQPRPEDVQIGTSRDFAAGDVENWVRATASITLTIPLNFSAMAVDRTLTVLRAYSGSDLTIQAATGVTLNGVSGGSVTLGTPYTAGVLLKTGANTYEFY